MKVKSSLVAACCLFALVAGSMSMAGPPAPAGQVKDRIGIVGPIRFGSESFSLAWGSHPSAQSYKQEYLPSGQRVERYTSMLMIDVVASGATPQSMAGQMVNNLKARKATDPVVNYDLITNKATNEIILDFVLSSEEADGQTIVEWNAYRYSPQGDGVRMVGISRRAYGDRVDPFLRNDLKNLRTRDIATLSALSLPAIKLDAR